MENVFQDKKMQDKFKRFEAGARDLKIDGLVMKTKPLLNKKVGVVLDGRIYPIIKGRKTNWSFLQSATTQNNKEIFKAVIQAVTKAKTKKEKEDAYITALLDAGNIPPNVSMFALRVADGVKVDARANNGLNLYKRQNIRQYYPADVTPPPPNTEPPKPAVASKKEMPDMKKEEPEKMEKKKMRGQEVVTDDPNAPLALRARNYDPTKYEGNPKMEMIKGKAIRVSKLQRGEFGYVFRGKIFPIWKADNLAVASNSWSMVESRMTSQEIELFKRMKEKNNDDALGLYYDFMEEVQNIPIEVISRGLEVANNKGTQRLVNILEQRMKKSGYTIEDGFNINFEPEGEKSVFQSLKGKFSLLLPVQKLKKSRTRLGNEEFKKIQYTKAEIKKIFDGIDIYNNVEIDKLKAKLTAEEMSQNIKVERDTKKMEEKERMEKREKRAKRLPSPIKDDGKLEVLDVDANGNIKEERAKQDEFSRNQQWRMSQNIRVERDTKKMEEKERMEKREKRAIPLPPPIKDDEELEVFDVDANGNIREERAKQDEFSSTMAEAEASLADTRNFDLEEPDAILQIPMEQRIGYNPPIPPNNNNNNIQMEISEGKNDAERRQIELNKATADEETKAEELEKDNIPDISKHGHQIAIQNVFIKEGKDFTFIKQQVKRNKYLNNDNKNIKAEIDLIYAYYSTLFPLTAPKEYSEDNCIELKTLEFQYKRNIQFERKWKSSLANSIGGGASAPNGQTMGAIINLENMGMTAQQLFQRGQPATQPPLQPTAPLNNPPTAPQNPAQKDSTGGNPVPKGTSALPLTDIQQKVIPQPQNIKPKSTRKRAKRVKFQDVKLKVRQKQIKTNLLFTNPKIMETPPQPEGDLPMFNFRNKINNRRKL